MIVVVGAVVVVGTDVGAAVGLRAVDVVAVDGVVESVAVVGVVCDDVVCSAPSTSTRAKAAAWVEVGVDSDPLLPNSKDSGVGPSMSVVDRCEIGDVSDDAGASDVWLPAHPTSAPATVSAIAARPHCFISTPPRRNTVMTGLVQREGKSSSGGEPPRLDAINDEEVNMSRALQPLPNFSHRPGPLLIVVADGVGVAPAGPSNAVTTAPTPMYDALTTSVLSTTLLAHGPAVGLPSDDDMGNSEVGHNALGAGRVFAQGAKLVNKAIADGSIYQTTVWKRIIASATIQNGRDHTLHFIGLHSDGGVHSNTEHLYALLEQAANEGVKRVRLHILLDGRDVGARSALDYIAQTEQVLQKINEHHRAPEGSGEPSADFRIGSGGGRMKITMDRYGADWDMVERGYQCHTNGVGRRFTSATEAVETMYAESETGDQYLQSFVIVDRDASGKFGAPIGTMHDGDAVVMFNFRGDRAIEISRAYEEIDFDVFDRGDHPDVYFAGMLQYDGDTLVPKNYLVDPPTIDRTMGEFLCAAGLRSFAISETQKFGHVTYFWNGNKSGYIDPELETYIEIPSDNVEFNTTPGMKLREITDRTIELLRSGDYDTGRLNFPNGDMVGHTGDLEATVEAMVILDSCLADLVAVIDELGGVLVFTADHGNADIMYTESGGVRSPKTSHTLSPVPFVIHDARYGGEYQMAVPDRAGLSNVAATVFNLLGYEAPDGYDRSLISFDTN